MGFSAHPDAGQISMAIASLPSAEDDKLPAESGGVQANSPAA
jgi:hypothetical protein